MRHTTATHMLEAGVPLVVIKQFLGHAHISTTEIYAKLSPTATSEKIRKWSEEYWNKYIDEPFNTDELEQEYDNVPDFLK